ncbi:MAG: endonuclease/exonuclease/phosphatase family protein [Clostridia bacterium]|nr:endonuclease/exonuclease/phosphatase family protein [Clostridia bacterium]
MKITTYNLRCVYDKDGANSFIHRVGMIYDKIKAEQPDVIAFQEVVPQELEVLEKLLTEYSWVGQARDTDYDGEGLFTAVRKETCQLLGFETIWLSPTPYLPGSRYAHQSDCPRICVQALVRHKQSKTVLRVFNLHLDHISAEARVAGIQAALDFTESYHSRDGHPVVILGDFNALPEEESITICNNHPGIQDVTANIAGTFHNFGRRTPPPKIDYIYMSDVLAEKVQQVQTWEDEKNGIYLSDHYPVCAELAL